MMQTQRLGHGLLVVTIILGLAGVALAQPPASEGPVQTGQRISLDLKGVDILDVLKLLSQKSHLNFIAGRNVSGRVTIFVNDVDVWEAFELIIGANDLAYERHGDIVTVMMARDYELLFGEKFQERKASAVISLRYAKVVQVATVLNQIKSSVGRVVADEATNTLILSDVPPRLSEMQGVVKSLDQPTESRVYQLNYTEAEKLKEKVQELLSPVGTLTFDARSNTAVITDLPEALQKVTRVVKAFDIPEGQVLIEAKIINVILNDSTSLGIDWQQVFAGVDSETRSNFLSRKVIGGNILSGAGTGSTIRLLSGGLGNDTKAVIEALKSVGRTETLSNPRIMVSSNQEAKILVGTKEAFITTTTTVPATGSTVTAPEIQFQDVGTKLFVTPNVKRDGYIQLKIRPEVSSVARTVTSVANTVVPIVQTTEAETNVLVKSGETLILAGLIDTKNVRSDNQLPWIGRIPIIGLLFRGVTDERQKSELVLFLTPQIVKPDGTAVEFPETGQAEVQGGLEVESSLPEVVLKDPVPSAYREKIRRQLQEQLTSQFRASTLQNGSVVVAFILSHDGRLVGEPDITSPQGGPFITAAKEAFAKAQPFAPFPEGSQASEVRFRPAVEYKP